MAGHSHWAGIIHKKGRVDKHRSKIFSKLSKEITVAAKLGSKDPNLNPRLRSAMQAARTANIPKDNHIAYECDEKCVIFYAAYPHDWKQKAGITFVPGIDPEVLPKVDN